MIKEKPIFVLKTNDGFFSKALHKSILFSIFVFTFVLILLLIFTKFNLINLGFILFCLFIIFIYLRFISKYDMFQSNGYIYSNHFIFPVSQNDNIMVVPSLNKTWSKKNKYEDVEFIQTFLLEKGKKESIQYFNQYLRSHSHGSTQRKNILSIIPTSDRISLVTRNNAFQITGPILRDPNFLLFMELLIRKVNGNKIHDLLKTCKSRSDNKIMKTKITNPAQTAKKRMDNVSPGIWIKNDMETNEGGYAGLVFMYLIWLVLWVPLLIFPFFIGNFNKINIWWLLFPFGIALITYYFIPYSYNIAVRRGRWYLSGFGHEKLNSSRIKIEIEQLLKRNGYRYKKRGGRIIEEKYILYRFIDHDYNLQLMIQGTRVSKLMDISVGPVNERNEKEIIELLKKISKWSKETIIPIYGKMETRYGVYDTKNLLKLNVGY